jgi:hypothetical protein
MNNYTKIKENSDMILDENSGAIINTNLEAYNAFKMKNKKSNMIIEHENEIHNIKEDISEIKSLLKTLIGKKEDE